jgi:hypothetical protein
LAEEKTHQLGLQLGLEAAGGAEAWLRNVGGASIDSSFISIMVNGLLP